jgi:thiamine-monophosphate kinase
MSKKEKTISNIGEFGLIEYIKRNNTGAKKQHNVCLDIGDDCFAFNSFKNSKYVVTTDILIEGSHFKKEFASAKQIASKAVEVNVSDIASMGTAKPLYLFISIGIPKNTKEQYIKDLFKGIKETCNKYNIHISGGDTVSSQLLTVSITLIGITTKKVITRTGAKIGDLIYVSNSFGDSGAGLQILLENKKKLAKHEKNLINKHLCPNARLELANMICEKTNVTSMTDSSDGLNKSIELLTTDNKKGAKIYLEQIPLSKDLIQYTSNDFYRKYNYALFGGEEFELVFTISPKYKNILEKLSKQVFCIGQVTNTNKVEYFENNKKRNFKNNEYKHF